VLLRGPDERFEENATVEPDPEETFAERGVREIEDGLALFRLAEQPIDAGPAREDVIVKAEAAKDMKPNRLNRDPGADGLRRRNTLVNGDLVASASEEHGRGSSGGAASNHSHVQPPH
jgi:hypothetical protein